MRSQSLDGQRAGIWARTPTLALLIALAVAMPIAAQEHGEAHPADSHAHPKNVVGALLGATHAGASEFSLGLEYEARLWTKVGFGVIGEYTSAAHGGEGVGVLLGAIHVHPAGGLRLSAGAGQEYIRGAHPADEALFRLGAAYDFPFGEYFALAPTVNSDFVNGHTSWVYGLVILGHF